MTLLSRFVMTTALGLPLLASAQPMTFNFADPKGVNGVLFKLDSQLEPIVGMATGLSGTITYDPADPTSFKGELSLPADQVVCSNPKMTAVLHGAEWINIGEHPLVTFTFDTVKEVEKEHGGLELEVAGSLTVAGQTLPMTVEVEVEYLQDAAKDRGAAQSGDLLVLRSDFSVERKAFGIKPDMGPSVVAHDIEIDVAVVGYSQ
jgi:polyisoprenoid-binding protein YceI